MLNRKSIERALARAAGHQDESVVARLALFAPALLKAADLRAQLAAEAPEWTDEEIEAARLGKETLLSLRPVRIDSERFLQTVDAIAAALLDNDEIEGDMLEACRAIDWRRFASAELLESAGRDPMGYLHAVEVHAGEDDLLDIFLLPVLGLALRVFLDEAADEGSRRIARTGTDTTHHNRPLHCPVCGSDAAVASVTDTPLNGHVKRPGARAAAHTGSSSASAAPSAAIRPCRTSPTSMTRPTKRAACTSAPAVMPPSRRSSRERSSTSAPTSSRSS